MKEMRVRLNDPNWNPQPLLIVNVSFKISMLVDIYVVFLNIQSLKVTHAEN